VKSRVLVVDDEPQFLRALSTNLRGAGYEVDTATTAAEALTAAGLRPPDAVVLDLLLPDGSGTDVCRALRTWTEAPIILVSAVGDEDEKIAALDAGADDYVTKPFGIEELLARIRAAMRRSPSSSEGGPHGYSAADLEIDFDTRKVRANGKDVRLTPKEFETLRYLVAHTGRPVTHREILQAVWGPDYGDEPEYLRVFINQLRKKIEANPAKPKYILTEPWVGYRFAG
jgi:two-component system KDP operon response regulator KdpE